MRWDHLSNQWSTVSLPCPGLIEISQQNPNILFLHDFQLVGDFVVEALRLHNFEPVLLQLRDQIVVSLEI